MVGSRGAAGRPRRAQRTRVGGHRAKAPGRLGHRPASIVNAIASGATGRRTSQTAPAANAALSAATVAVRTPMQYLRATSRLRRVSLARYTWPIPPSPRRDTTSYALSRRPGVRAKETVEITEDARSDADYSSRNAAVARCLGPSGQLRPLRRPLILPFFCTVHPGGWKSHTWDPRKSATLFGFDVCWAPDRAPRCRCGSWSSSMTALQGG